MAQHQTELLIDHLDNSLLGKGSVEAEQLIVNDPEAAQEWHFIRMAVDAVQNAALYEQVGSIKKEWQATHSTARPGSAVIRTIYKNVLRAAACVFLVAGGAALYKYTTATSSGLYEQYYSAYDLNASRSNEKQDALEQAYNSRDWKKVVTLAGALKEKNNKAYFLTGIADMELKNYNEAIGKFQQIIAANVQTGADYFQDEAEYYLAMSWLARNDVNEAMPLLEKIKANKSHLYYEKVSKMSFTDLKIVRYKNLK